MAVTVTATEFPPIHVCRIHQASDASPGLIIMDTAIGTITQLPRITTVNFSAGTFNGSWADCRIHKAPRVRSGKLRVVLQDSRWKLRETRLSYRANTRDSLGRVMTDHQQTVAQLVTMIANATGLTITTGTVPTFYPRADWIGVTAEYAMNQLLHDTGCRMVYNPTTGGYVVSQAATGLKPTAPAGIAQLFRGGLPAKPTTYKLQSAPTMYETRWDGKAVKINRTTGALIDADAEIPSDPTDEETNVNLRYWAPVSIGHPAAIPVEDALLLPYRAKSHLNTAGNRRVMEKASVVREGWEPFPYHQQFLQMSEDLRDDLAWTSDGQVIVEDHPQLVVDATGALQITGGIKVLSAYLVRQPDTNGKLLRLEHSVNIGGAAGELIEVADWIKPVNSTEDDMTGEEWSTLLSDVGAAMALKHSGDAETIRYSAPFNLAGNGRVGGVRYEAQTTLAQPRLFFQVALDFTPSNAGDIK